MQFGVVVAVEIVGKNCALEYPPYLADVHNRCNAQSNAKSQHAEAGVRDHLRVSVRQHGPAGQGEYIDPEYCWPSAEPFA